MRQVYVHHIAFYVVFVNKSICSWCMQVFTIMSTSSAPTSAQTATVSPKNSEKKVMKVLEKKLKGKTPVKESPKSSQASLTVKQVINENMLAARARWLTQNKDKEEEIDVNASMSCGGGGSVSGESDFEEIRGRRLALSHGPSKNIQLDDNKDIEPSETRGFSDSVPNALILKTQQTQTSSTTNKAGAIASGPKIFRGGKQSSDGVKKESSVSSTSSAVKKLFGFKPKKKRKRTRKMTRIAPTRVGSVKGVESEKKNGGRSGNTVMEKSMSDSAIVIQKVRAFTSSAEDEPMHMSSHGYQNVFDNPQFAKYTQQHQQRHDSHSNTSSPSDNLQTKKPKPLPRPNIHGNTIGRCSTESDQEPVLETLPAISSITTNSLNSAHMGCLTHVRSLSQHLSEGVDITSVGYIYDSENSLGKIHSERSGSCTRSGSMEPKESLGKTVSYNPDSMVLLRSGSSRKQKELRRGICSEGDQNEFDLEDEYIEMKSISLLKDTTPSSVSTDTERQSVYYLEILPNLHELEPKKNSPLIKPQSKMETSSRESKGGVKSEKPHLLEHHHKVNTVPSISINSTRNVKTPLVLGKTPPEESHAEGSKSTLSTTPPKSNPIFAKSDNQEFLKPSRRKFQYTPVMVEAAGKQRELSAPKTMQYQTVTLDNKNEKLKVTEREEKELHEKLTTPTVLGPLEERRENLKVDSTSQDPKVKQHPLVSSQARRSPMRSVRAERNYVNRESLVVMENLMNLHTSMFSTVDPITGKVQWHEYVEMDEDEIDRLAASIGMVKSAPIIPDKLETLLNIKPQEQPCQDGFEGKIEDSELSCDSTSSDCKYILNLNEPPTVPSRPENLDELVDKLEMQSSDDYSYAFTPGMGMRWKMRVGKKNATSLTNVANNTCPITITEDTAVKCKDPAVAAPRAKTSISASKSVPPDTKKLPPSLPPRTESLLREQELVKGQSKKKTSSQSYILPILVKTKEKYMPKSHLPTKSLTNLLLSPDKPKPQEQGTLNNIKEDTQAHDYQPRRRITPPKPIPYKEHQKQRLQGQKTTTTLLSSPDSPNKQEMVRNAETKKSVSRSTAYKKLARQRSHRTSKGRVRNHKSASQQKEELEIASVSLSAGLDRKSSHQERKLSQGSWFKSFNRESMAILVQNQDAITKELFASRTESEHDDEGSKSAVERNETEASQKVRDLSDILVELRHLLKISDFSEKDILSAIESHLKMTHKTENDEKERTGESVDEEGTVEEVSIKQDSDDYDEEEEWMSGDEPESDIEVGEISEPIGCAKKHPLYINFQVCDEELEPKPIKEPENVDDEELILEKTPRAITSESCDKEEGVNRYSYISNELWTGIKINGQRHYSSSDVETNLDRTVRGPQTPIPSSKDNKREVSDGGSATPRKYTSVTSSSLSSFSDGCRERSMTAVAYSSPTQNQRQKSTPRSSRSYSNPIEVAVVESEAATNQSIISSMKFSPQKHKGNLESDQSEKTLSYCLALQMEDRHLSQASEISTYKGFCDVREGKTRYIPTT